MRTTDYKERKRYSEHDELQTTKRGSTVSTTDYKERKKYSGTMNYRLQRKEAQ